MNIHRLEYFVTVADTGSFSEAAEVLFTTQGAVSKQIISLENELNVKLFRRNSRKASLTEDGKNVLFYANDILKPYREMHNILNISVHEQNRRAIIDLAVTPVYRLYNMLTLINSFCSDNPSTSLRIDEREFVEFINPLEKGDFEIAFGPKELTDQKKFECLNLDKDSLAVALPKSHALANEKSLRVNQLRKDKFVFISEKVGLYDACMNFCNKNGFIPQVMYVSSHLQNISQIIEQKGYVCLTMNKIAKSMCPDTIASVPIEDGFVSTLALIRQKESKRSPIAEKFWNYTKNYIS